MKLQVLGSFASRLPLVPSPDTNVSSVSRRSHSDLPPKIRRKVDGVLRADQERATFSLPIAVFGREPDDYSGRSSLEIRNQ